MIIIDFNAVAMGVVNMAKEPLTEDLLRHFVLNSLRMYNVKYRKKYGKMVLACDSRSWRKDFFPEYKFKRAGNREKSKIDWNQIFEWFNNLLADIENNFPWTVLRIWNCEADDIIGAIVRETQEFGNHDEIMIISGDKDFIQLHVYGNVRQWSPITKKFVQDNNPHDYIFEHLLKGDSGDGVPNILSPDNTFSEGIRQSPMTKKKIAFFTENKENLQGVMTEEQYRNYCRNKKMIDLHEIPEDLYKTIIDTFEAYKPAPKMKVLNYLIKKRCKLLIECTEEFY